MWIIGTFDDQFGDKRVSDSKLEFGRRDPMHNLDGFVYVVGFDTAFKQQIVGHWIQWMVTISAVRCNYIRPNQIEMGHSFVINALMLRTL